MVQEQRFRVRIIRWR